LAWKARLQIYTELSSIIIINLSCFEFTVFRRRQHREARVHKAND
jgi:hypothetical protein